MPVFVNRAPDDPVAPANPVPNDSLANIRGGDFNYVVLDDGTLLVGKSGHIDLASGEPVVAAGEVKIVNGEVRTFDNASGHYRPTGPSVSQQATAAFERAGLHVASNAYRPVA